MILWRRWLTGDIEIPADAPKQHKKDFDALRRLLAQVAKDVSKETPGKRVTFRLDSGYRTYAEQEHLYKLWIEHIGNLAAKPGLSNHERGKAADVYIGVVPVGHNGAVRRAMKRRGLCLPVKGEPWHVERGTTWNA